MTTNSTNCVVRIQGLSSAGQGVARAEDGKVVFIEGALPDETCLIRRHYHKRTFDRGTLLEIVTPSPDRIEPRCPHYSECGGCQLQHLRYSEQLVFKHTRIREAFSRIAGFSDVPI
ncbi:MAG TPA: TRAM domain-containing protein, partial [bacterium]|nr:TRAM domain-containing protein [bacterium]